MVVILSILVCRLWKEKGTVRGNYSAMGLAAAVNQDASVATSVVTRKAKMDPRKSSSLSLGTGQLQIAGHFRMHAEFAPQAQDEGDQRSKAVEVRAHAVPRRVWLNRGQ